MTYLAILLCLSLIESRIFQSITIFDCRFGDSCYVDEQDIRTEDGGLPHLSFLPVPLCHYANEQFISNWIFFQWCDVEALLTSSISSVKTLLSNWKVFMSFSLVSIYSNLLSWHIQQNTDVFMIACANLLFYNKVIDGTIIKWIASQFLYQFGVTYTHHLSWIK